MVVLRVALAVGLMCAATSVSAQVYAPAEADQPESATVVAETLGLQLGLGLNGSAIRASDLSDEIENGGGLHFHVGYGFTTNITAFAGGAGANMNDGDYSLGHFDLGVRGYFPGTSAWVPYLEGAFTGRAILLDAADAGTRNDLEVTGTGFTGGAGVAYYTTPALSLGVGLAYTFGDFTDAKMGRERTALGNHAFGATTTRFNLGVTWWP